jgi:hypothetical protein
MKPRSHIHAQKQIVILMRHKVSGRSSNNKKILLKKYAWIIEQIWRHWNVGIYQMKLHHVQWLLEEKLSHLSSGTRYKYWRWVADILVVTEKYDNWESALRGPWRNPNGKEFSKRNSGRKPKIKTSKRYPGH